MLQTLPWLLVSILYSPVFYQLYLSRWEALDYTHAYFILPIALLIAWLKRKDIINILPGKGTARRAPTASGCILFILSLLLFIFGWRWDYLFVQTFSLIPLLLGIILFLYNKQTLNILLFPILYLILLLPIPIGILDNITLPMRYGASVLSAKILTLMGYDIAREGLLINMGGHEIFMGAPCSGFRSLITMLSLGLVYIYFNQGKTSKNITLFLSIFPLTLIGNLIRIITLCLITYYFGEEAGQGFFHNFSGMVVFLIITLGLMSLEKILNDK